MEITCRHCHARLNIPDEKIPKGKKASFNCPKCKQRLEILPEQGSQTKNGNSDLNIGQQGVKNRSTGETANYDASDRPFDFLDEDARTALLCIENRQSEKVTHKILDDMKYHMEIVHDIQTALTRMKYHLFNIIVIDEAFDRGSKGMKTIMAHLNELNMTIRRRIVVILMSEELRTMDNMAIFNKSVNQIINNRDIKEMDKLLKRTIQEHEQFYTVFNESLRKIGKK